jgi:23S rRNA pseudouridine2604 synthase
MSPDAPPEEPVRVSKLLAERGLCSRREADAFIARGWVLLDGRPVTELGTKALRAQTLALDPRAASAHERKVTILLHKPLGIVSGQAEDGHTDAATLVTAERHFAGDPSGIAFEGRHAQGLAPAGRLDIDSTGLLVLTQNGVIARQLIGDDTKVEKEYQVRVDRPPTPEELALLNHGLRLDGRALRPARVRPLPDGRLEFILREGRKRQIRRMCELVGLKVVALKRVRIGRVRLGALPPGQWRYLGRDEAF